MLSIASDWANNDSCSVYAHAFKGEALVMMAKDCTDEEEAVAMCKKGIDCLKRALDLCPSRSKPNSKQHRLELMIYNSRKIKCLQKLE